MVTVRENGYEISVEAEIQDGRLVTREVRVSQVKNGPPVTSEALRQVRVAELTRRYWPPGPVLDGRFFGKRPAGGPDDTALEVVGLAYRRAMAVGEPPTEAVMQALGLPRSTAGRWVALAREQGYLKPSRGRGRAGG